MDHRRDWQNVTKDNLLPVPDFSSEMHKRFRRCARLKAVETNTYLSSRKVLAQLSLSCHEEPPEITPPARTLPNRSI